MSSNASVATEPGAVLGSAASEQQATNPPPAPPRLQHTQQQSAAADALPPSFRGPSSAALSSRESVAHAALPQSNAGAGLQPSEATSQRGSELGLSQVTSGDSERRAGAAIAQGDGDDAQSISSDHRAALLRRAQQLSAHWEVASAGSDDPARVAETQVSIAAVLEDMIDASQSDPELLDWMLQAGGDPNENNTSSRFIEDPVAPVLCIAATLPNSAVLLEKLLAAGADKNSRLPNGSTALRLAAEVGNVGAVRVLVRAGADCDVEDNAGSTAFMAAVMNGHLSCSWALMPVRAVLLYSVATSLKILLVLIVAFAAYVLFVAKSSWAARNCMSHTLYSASFRGDLGCLQYLLEEVSAQGRFDEVVEDEAHTFEVAETFAGRERTPAREWQPLPVAAQEGHLDCVLALLAAGARVDAVGMHGATALHRAARRGHAAIVDTLIRHRADLEKRTTNGDTALMYAVRGDSLDCVRALAGVGANVEAANDNGWRALHVAAQQGRVEFVSTLVAAGANLEAATTEAATALIFAAGNGHVDCVTALAEKGAKLEAAENDGWRALHFAAQNGHVDCVRALAQAGANLEAATTKGGTALHIAAGNGHVECLRALLERGAQLEATTELGSTALHFAAQRGRTACAEVLLAARANIDAALIDGETALYLAAKSNHVDCMRLLITADAKLDAALTAPEIISDQRVPAGATPLWAAADSNSVEAVHFLLEQAADKSVVAGGETALEVARRKHHDEVVSLLS